MTIPDMHLSALTELVALLHQRLNGGKTNRKPKGWQYARHGRVTNPEAGKCFTFNHWK